MTSFGFVGAHPRSTEAEVLTVPKLQSRAPRARGLLVSLVLVGMAISISAAGGLLAVRRTDAVEASAQAALRRQLVAGQVAAPVQLINQPAAGDQVPVPVQFFAEEPAAAPGSPIAFLRIPAIGVDKVVVEGTGTEQLRTGPGHYPGTAMPGSGTFGVAGYRFTYGAPFLRIGDLNATDKIYVSTADGLFTYRVTGTGTVESTDNSSLSAGAEDRLTITTTAASLGDDRRLVVTAELEDYSPRAAPKLEIPPGGPASAYPEPDPLVDSFELNPLGRLAATNVTPNKPAPPPSPTSGAVGEAATGDPGAASPGSEEPGQEAPPPQPPPPLPEPPPAPAPAVVATSPAPKPSPTATGPIHRSPNRFAPACRNGIDDDGDGLIDFRSLDGKRQDPGCNGENDDDE